MTEQPDDPVRSARDEFTDDIPLSTEPPTGEQPGEQPGDLIDGYKLLQEIGEGGMGTVWMAEQKEPVRRQVALKIIKLGMDTKEVVVRFEAERQALALMDHPNIARVLDGGATANGRPYFVMELVRGVPITQFCDEARFGLRERLELFTTVCQAVQHAHHKGVIHRDLKPSNIMVTLNDGTPMPKVIDFGIAKATSAELTQKTLFTQYGTMVGTPEYMAPEQAEMSALDVDTRADVYSLGVLLYELLTGTKPFDVTKVLERGYQELLRTIREEDPARPSTRVSTLGEGAAPIARNRHVNVAALRTRLRGEIDWIVMKALEKDRHRRYETATGFAADVQRLLAGEPVVAAPPSHTYRLRKFLARRRRTVLAAVVILVLFFAGAIGTGVGWWKADVANRELLKTNRELEQANRDKSLALDNEMAARRAAEEAEARVIEKSLRFQSIIRFHEERLAEMSPQTAGATLREILLEQVPTEQRAALSSTLSQVNLTDVGIAAIERTVLDPTLDAIQTWVVDDPSAKARLLNGTTVAFNSLRRYSRSLQISEQALALLESIGGRDSDLGLTVQASIAIMHCVLGRPEAAEPFARAALSASRRDGVDPRSRGQAHYALGMALLKRMELDGAKDHIRSSLKILATEVSDAHPSVMFSRRGLLSALMNGDELEEGEAFAKESLAISRKHYPESHRRVVYDRMALIEIQRRRGTLAAAESMIEGLMSDTRKAFGVASQEATDAALMLSLVLIDASRLDDAERLLRAELKNFTRKTGDPADKERIESALIRIVSRRGNLRDAAEKSAERLDEARKRGETGMRLVTQLVQRGVTSQSRGELDAAERCFTEALQKVNELGKREGYKLAIRARLGATWRAQGKFAKAETELRSVLEQSRELLGPDHPVTLSTMNSLAVALRNRRKQDEGLPLLAQLVEHYRSKLGDRHPQTLFARNNHGGALQAAGRIEEALAIYREVLDQQTDLLGESHPQSLFTRLNMAGALVQLDRFEEAQQLITDLLEPLEAAYSARHELFTTALRTAGAADFGAGNPNGGEAHLSRALALARKHQPKSVPAALYELANELLEHGRPDRAEPLLAELISLREQTWNGDYRDANSRLRLAASQGMQGQFAKHAGELEEHLAALLAATRADVPARFANLVRSALEVALRYYEAWHKVEPTAETDAAIKRLRRQLEAAPR